MALRRLFLSVFVLIALAAPANATITITFYAHKLATHGGWLDFPHAYVTLTGTTEAAGTPVNTNFGFTAKELGFGILFGWVDGTVASADASYLAVDKPVFAFPISDAQYDQVLAVADQWRKFPQPSYEMDKHNCMTFVNVVAETLGLAVVDDRKFGHDPVLFLDDMRTRNTTFLARADATAPPGTPQPAPQATAQRTPEGAAEQPVQPLASALH